MNINSTIAAIATPPGNGGIAIIRISGEKSIEIADKIFQGKKKISEMNTHTIQYGHVVDPNSHLIVDEVLVSVMKKPHSYTGEDVVEVNCHGGYTVAREVLIKTIQAGAAMAEAGEFTKRAFFHHRIDLAQAEAIIDIITAKNKEAVQGAVNQLGGALSEKINQIRDQLIQLMAAVQAEADFPEEGISGINESTIAVELSTGKKKLKELLETAETGKLIREGIATIIIGKPNVGKSSLLNALLGENRAIVTDLPGTTRDTIEEYLDIGGITLKLVDTAGIRETENTVEQIGVTRAKEKMEEADLILFVVDSSTEPTEEDKKILSLIHKQNCIFIMNKEDKIKKEIVENYEKMAGEYPIIYTSAKNGTGIGQIKKLIKERFHLGKIQSKQEVMLTNVRHIEAISHALEAICSAEETLLAKMPVDCLFIDLMTAIEQLGSVTGMSVDEEVVNRIFRDFCVGK